MYDLPYYKEPDEKVIREFMSQHPFVFLAGCDASGLPVATQVPVFTEDRGGRLVLQGHLMKNTDHHRAFLGNPQVLAVFTGPHTYVSATWYDNPRQASTWNYMSVQASGRIRFLEDSALEDVLRRTSLHFENNNAGSSTVYDNLPPGYTEKLVKAIVAFEVDVTQVRHVFKLSQDRTEASYENIIKELRAQGGDAAAIAGEMEKRKTRQFPK
jgi:transcriptional regulator